MADALFPPGSGGIFPLTAEEEPRWRTVPSLHSMHVERVWATLDAARAERDAAEHRCYRLSAPIAADELAALRALADEVAIAADDRTSPRVLLALANVAAIQGPR